MSRNGLRGFPRGGPIRDRLTVQVAIGLFGALVVGATVFGVGVAGATYELSDIGAWLTAKRKGTLVHANGLVGRIDGKAGLAASMRGHDVRVVQDGGTVLIVDLQTGVVSRLDPSQLKVEQSRGFGAAGLQVVIGRGGAYTVDPVGGAVQRIDPMTLAAIGSPVTLPPPLGAAGMDATGTLWVPAPQNGQVVPFRDGGQAPPVPVGRPGDRLSLTIAAGAPVVVNSTAANATVIKASGDHLQVALPSGVRESGRAGVLAPPLTEGAVVPLLAAESGSLVMLHTGTGAPTAVRLKRVGGHRFGAPHMLGSKVYLPDETVGALLVYNAETNGFEQRIPVSGRPSRLEVFVKDGLLWANDPDGARAVVLDDRGAAKEVRKYEEEAPDGRSRSPLPVPSPTHDGPDRPEPHPTDPRRPNDPRRSPNEPSAPEGVVVSPGNGEMTIRFRPSVGGRPTGYVLAGLPAGLVASPSRVPPGGPYVFRVTGGDCDRSYRFTVAVRYEVAGRSAQRASEPSDQVRPCTPPGAPGGVVGTATSQGAKVTWQAPAGAAPDGYTVSWSGTKSGSLDVTGTSAVLSDVWKNGSYTIKVTARNAAGGREASWSGTLTGPAQSYAIRHNGKSYANMRAAPDSTSTMVHQVFDNGHTLVVHCQKKGAYYANDNGKPYFAGDLYDLVEYEGKRGYMIGYLVSTPKEPWQEYAGPSLWECA
ncbi:Streptogramin lyase [Thermomonospora echinospora]|uniref:Streptogramin lyase n=1 Tax=Thermomonospora echinospora TaxID=1992 RepID=A0A1H5X260_9ACTN|nr:hypothetical protein [Thermomonospora echinospora]SEG05623.1 Streptogramin lyase [Thermomonospora echinospora]